MRSLTTLVLSLFVLCAMAQTAQEEIRQNPCLAGSNHRAYPTPTKALTAAPAGKTPFYISHYGRHGSRYLIGGEEYTTPQEIFRQAAAAGMLTDKGADVLEKIEQLCTESANRLGDLTLLGAQQHQEIAQRMYERFPTVFTGDVVVAAKSTVVRRCILSMANELMALKALNPALTILSDASEHDMYYMNFQDKHLWEQHSNEATRDYLRQWTEEHIHPAATLSLLFAPEYLSEIENPTDLYIKLFNLATIVQNSELRHTLSLYDLFSDDDLYALWQRSNLQWFCSFGPNSLNGGTQPFSQRHLLRKIIAEADSCLALATPGATLRFGHDTMVMPLTCLLDLNGYGQVMHPSEVFANDWADYRIFPMACNIQFIFYRSDPDDSDVWVKVLLNEEEATLPLTAVYGPYYRWADVKEHYTAVLDAYKEE